MRPATRTACMSAAHSAGHSDASHEKRCNRRLWRRGCPSPGTAAALGIRFRTVGSFIPVCTIAMFMAESRRGKSRYHRVSMAHTVLTWRQVIPEAAVGLDRVAHLRTAQRSASRSFFAPLIRRDSFPR